MTIIIVSAIITMTTVTIVSGMTNVDANKSSMVTITTATMTTAVTTRLKAEKQTDPVEERDRAQEALIALFKEAKTKDTHIVVECIVADIDGIVKKVRFDGWKNTS